MLENMYQEYGGVSISEHFLCNGNSVEYAEMFDLFCTVCKRLTYPRQVEK